MTAGTCHGKGGEVKKLLSYGGAALITAALLDLMFQAGAGRHVAWFRDLFMGGGGVACLYLLLKYRKQL